MFLISFRDLAVLYLSNIELNKKPSEIMFDNADILLIIFPYMIK